MLLLKKKKILDFFGFEKLLIMVTKMHVIIWESVIVTR